jgi:leucyl-tRNA synthetase
MRFNTALAALMEQLNYIQKLNPYELGRFVVESYVLMLAPLTPFIAEEFWRELGHNASIHQEPWPKYEPELTRDETVTVVVQVNGKVRDRLEIETGTAEAAVQAMALEREGVRRHLDGKPPKKIIYVRDKLVSIVV